jgi:hypothetical protein
MPPRDRQTRDKHENSREIDDWWDLLIVEMRLNKRKLRSNHYHQGWAQQSSNTLRVLHSAPLDTDWISDWIAGSTSEWVADYNDKYSLDR